MSNMLGISADPEMWVMAALAWYPEKTAHRILSRVTPEMIRSEANREIYNRARSLHMAGRKIHALDLVKGEDANNPIGPRLGELACAYGHLGYVNVGPAITQLQERYKTHMARVMADRLLKAHPDDLSEMAVAEEWTRYREALRLKGDPNVTPLADVVDEWGTPEKMEELERSHVRLGWRTFMQDIKIRRGDLIYFAGRPGMGKTDFALGFAMELSRKDQRVGILSMEMRKQYLMKRLRAFAGGSMENLARHGYNIIMDDASSQTIDSIRDAARYMVDHFAIDILIIDYLTLIEAPRAENRNQEVTKLSRELKVAAGELDIPFWVLAQLSRKVEDRADKRPQLADLRESGSIEQDADVVLFAYRPEYYLGEDQIDREPEKKHLLELIIGKQRDGRTGVIPFHYDPANKVLNERDFSGMEPAAPWRQSGPETAPF